MSTNQTKCSRSVAARQTRILLGCYRKGEAADPEVYVTSVATVLAGYPENVVMLVTNPLHGIPGKSDWLPTVAEVRAACEAEMKPIYDEAARQKRESDRALLLAAPDAPTPEARARAVEFWETQGRPEMQGGGDPVAPTEPPDEKLARLKREGWGTIVIGAGAQAIMDDIVKEGIKAKIKNALNPKGGTA